MKFKEYEMPDGKKAVFEYDENGVGKVTLECMDMLMGLINDRKTENSSEKPNNCEDLQDWKDRMWAEAIVTEPTISKMEQVEPQTDTEIAKAIVHKMIDDAVIAEDAYPDLRQKMHDAVEEYEPQTERKE